jgi:hypothetical protein
LLQFPTLCEEFFALQHGCPATGGNTVATRCGEPPPGLFNSTIVMIILGIHSVAGLYVADPSGSGLSREKPRHAVGQTGHVV